MIWRRTRYKIVYALMGWSQGLMWELMNLRLEK